MLKLRILATAAVLALCASSAIGQSFMDQNGLARSAFRDLSNVTYGAECAYGFQMDYIYTTDPDGNPIPMAPLYINAFELAPSADWDPNIVLDIPTGFLDYEVMGSNGAGWGHRTYNFGDAITLAPPPSNGDPMTDTSPEYGWYFKGAVLPGAYIDPSVADGVYHTTLNILGGADNAAMGTLFTADLTLQVAEKLDIDVTVAGNPGAIAQGQVSELFMTVKNNMTGLDFVSTTHFWSAFDDGKGNNLHPLHFDGNWGGQIIAPGDSRTDAHSTWEAMDNTDPTKLSPLGTYTGNVGVVGGLYQGDWYFVNNNPQIQLKVTDAAAPVPEPAFVQLGALLGLSGLGLLRRRRA